MKKLLCSLFGHSWRRSTFLKAIMAGVFFVGVQEVEWYICSRCGEPGAS